MRVTIDESRIPLANMALHCFAPGSNIERRKSGLYVAWRYHDSVMSRRWVTRGGDFYPVWSHRWGHGGTCCTALSQLIRWIRHQPVLPMPTWRYWAGDKVRLAGECGPQLIQILSTVNYPEEVPCVLCGIPLTGSLDWWHLDVVSGPCCNFTKGCRQKGRAA